MLGTFGVDEWAVCNVQEKLQKRIKTEYTRSVGEGGLNIKLVGFSGRFLPCNFQQAETTGLNESQRVLRIRLEDFERVLMALTKQMKPPYITFHVGGV